MCLAGYVCMNERMNERMYEEMNEQAWFDASMYMCAYMYLCIKP